MSVIRELQFEDIPSLIAYLRLQRDIFGITEAEAINADMAHYRALCKQWMDSNCSFVAVDNSRVVGIALGITIPSVWSPNRAELHLMAVQADNKITAGKLFKTWHDKAVELDVNRILVDRIEGTNFNYEKLGFTKLRETYKKENGR